MLYAKVFGNDNKVYVKVSGYLESGQINNFVNDYKKQIKGIKTSRYNLVVDIDPFDIDNFSDIKNVCMMFYKNGYKKIYLVDPTNYIMSNVKLKPIERKMFLKVVKIVNSESEVM